MGFDALLPAVGASPGMFAASVRAEHGKWRLVVKPSGASVD